MATYDDYNQPPSTGGYQDAPSVGPRGSSGKALASLLLGIASFCTACLTGIPAIILGFWSLADIRSSNGRMTGGGMAVTGIVTGILGTFCGLGCGGLMWFGLNMISEMAKSELNTNFVVQQHIGNLESISINWVDTMEAREKEKDLQKQNELWSFDVKGPKGEGIARTHLKQEGDKMRLLGGTLELKNGQQFNLMGGDGNMK